MSGLFRSQLAATVLAASCSLLIGTAFAQNNSQDPQTNGNAPDIFQPTSPSSHNLGANAESSNSINEVTPSTADLLGVPHVNNIPGAVSTGPEIKNPMANDPSSAQRGMKYFVSFNCVGCHMANGGGGMGPSLSNSFFKFGDNPAQIYLVISHGAPLGMPAWGTIIPDSAIWDIVSYIQSISKTPTTWGTTVNAAQKMPAIEQVPAEFMETTTPWKHVEPFSSGQKPTGRKPTGSQTPTTTGQSFPRQNPQ